MQKNLAFLIVKINKIKIWYNIQSKQYKNEASDMLTDTGQNMHFCFCDNSIWNRVGRNFSALSHHRTCRSAYGGSI